MNPCNPTTTPANKPKSAPPVAPQTGRTPPRYERRGPDADRAFEAAVQWFLTLSRAA